jgi:hypothetical protein
MKDHRIDILWALLPALLSRTGGPINAADLEHVGGGSLIYPRDDSDDADAAGARDHVIAYLRYAEGFARGGRGLIDHDLRPSGPARQGTLQAEWLEDSEADIRWRVERAESAS